MNRPPPPLRALALAGLLVAALAGCAGAASAGETPISPETYQAMLGRGMDVDWVKTPARIRQYGPDLPRAFAARGFSHVRIRMREAATPDYLDHVEKAVRDSLDAGLIPVLAYKADAFKKAPTAENMRAFVENWAALAERFASYPPELSFDLIIEVTDALNRQPETLNRAYEAAVAAIRRTNPTRIIFISAVQRSAPEKLALLKIPSQANGYLMAEWHFYASGPSPANPKKLWTTGTEAERALIEAKIAAALRWQEASGIRTWVGAWMAGNYNKGDDYSVPEQVGFARFTSCALERAQMPNAINSSNKFYDDRARAWIAEMAPVLDAYLAGCG